MLNNNAANYSEIIAQRIGAITFTPDFEPRVPSDMEEEIDEEQIDDLVMKALDVLTTNSPEL